MDLLEYQSRELIKDYGIYIDQGTLLNADNYLEFTPNSFPVVIKAQVKTGGRGKLGGVKLANNIKEFYKFASDILNLKIKHCVVREILVVKARKIYNEFYCAITFDRSISKYLLMFSQEGGMDIEHLAQSRPDLINKAYFSAINGINDIDFNDFFKNLDLSTELISELIVIIEKLWTIYKDNDATLVEINPLAVLYKDLYKVNSDSEFEIMPIDAKISLDDNANFRHKSLFEKYTIVDNENELEIEAQKNGLAYVKLDGSVGVIGNGAGLVLSTIDLIADKGKYLMNSEISLGERVNDNTKFNSFDNSKSSVFAANFLDIGGGASSEHMRDALNLISKDKQVKVILINIFGGLTNCELVAKGIVDALKEENNHQIVISLSGNNSQKGNDFLKDTIKLRNLNNLIIFDNQEDAVIKAVQIAKKSLESD